MILELSNNLQNKSNKVFVGNSEAREVVATVAAGVIHNNNVLQREQPAPPRVKRVKRHLEESLVPELPVRVEGVPALPPLKKLKKHFAVSEIPKECAHTYIPLIESWILLTLEYEKRLGEEEVDLPLRQRFSDAQGVLECMLTSIKNINLEEEESEFEDSILLCEDSEGIQAMACADMESCHLSLLVTHPNNIQDNKRAGERPSVRGAGTEIVLYLAQYALRTGNTITLSTFPESVDFYKKLQFEVIRVIPGECEAADMELSAQRVHDLVTRKIIPFNKLSV